MLVDTKTASGAIDVSPNLLRQLVREKKVPCYKLSERTLRFDLDELRAHMRLLASAQTNRDDEQHP